MQKEYLGLFSLTKMACAEVVCLCPFVIIIIIFRSGLKCSDSKLDMYALCNGLKRLNCFAAGVWQFCSDHSDLLSQSGVPVLLE